jgi:uncharacterized RDD family membrane protein YckC
MTWEDRLLTPTPEGVTLDVELAGLGSRFAAFLLDFILQSIVFGVIVFTVIEGFSHTGTSYGQLIAGLIVLSFVAVYVGYFVLCELLWSGRSIGKRLTGLRVMRMNGAPEGFWSILLRNVARLVDWLPSFYLVGVISILASTNNQRLGDMLAGTVVVRERDGADSLRHPEAAGANQRVRETEGWARSTDLPPALQSWDVSAITDEEINLVRRFLLGRDGYSLEARARLASTLANRLLPRVTGTVGPLDAETFLENVSLVRAARR